MKAANAKKSSTTSRTATQVANQPFFAKAGGGDFFAPVNRAAVPSVQMKMAVNKPGDKFEQEADKMAGKVMRMPTPAASAPEEKVQRQEDDKLQKKEEEKIQKAEQPEEKIKKKDDEEVRKAALPEEQVQKQEREKVQKAEQPEEKIQKTAMPEEKVQKKEEKQLQKKNEEEIQKAEPAEEQVQKVALPEEQVQKQEKEEVQKAEQPEEKLQKKEEEKIQKATAEKEKLQRQADDKLQKKEEKEKLQTAPADEEQLQRKGNGTPAVSSNVQSAIRSKTTGGQPLSSDVRSFMEPRFSADFSNVRVHNDAESAGLSNQLSARAFTYQNHIFFSRDQYQPGSSEGKQLLAHELTHVVQYDRGRMPSNGILKPMHELEKEAYVTERQIVTKSSSIDNQRDKPTDSESTSNHYRGEPARVSAINEQSAGSNGGDWRLNTTEAALIGDSPSAQGERSGAASAQPPIKPAGTRHAVVPSSDASGLMSIASVPSAMDAAIPQTEVDYTDNQVVPPGADAAATENRASPSSSLLRPAPSLREPTAWLEKLTSEGTQRVVAIQVSASTSIDRIRRHAEDALRNSSSAFETARARFESTAQTTFAAIDSFRTDGEQRISAEVTAQSTDLDAHFATSAENAHGSAEVARERITRTTENEARRSINESAIRAGRARGLAQSVGTDAEAPLAAGQHEIASRISDEMAQQCLLTGQDAAVEVRKAGKSRVMGINTYLEQVLQTLESARSTAYDKLLRTETEASVTLAEQAGGVTEETEARRLEGILALNQQEASLTSWIQEQTEEQCEQISTHSEEGVTNFSANFETITERFNEVAGEVEPIFVAVSPEEVGVSLAQDAFSEEMIRIWTTFVAPQLAEGESLATSFEDHAVEVEKGIMDVSTDALVALEQTVGDTMAGLTTLGERFSRFIVKFSERTFSTVRDGTAATRAETGRAVAEHTNAVSTEANQAELDIQSAIDQQLTWEDQQVNRAAEEISAGQAQAAQQYRNLEAQARAMDESGASAAVARDWLGGMWNWFSDLAESTLEWFQEKLGAVWGNIIGHILRGLIYVVGVLACGVAWVGAQVINIVYGFLWGETAIPGYGGGFFAFIADVIAGVLIIGDIRDLFKYGIWRPFITGEGSWWLNLTMVILTVVFMIPVAGDILKVIVKGLKSGGKGVLKLLVKMLGKELAERIMRRIGIEVAEEFLERLTLEVGEELAKRMIRELGEEGAEELLERLGKETIQHLGREISPPLMRDLADELGERMLKRLAESLGGNAIRTLSTDLGREAIEKLLRTVTPEVVEELHRRLGKDVLLNLLEGLRGVTIKEYLDDLGDIALRNLCQDLNGYAVKELFDDLGADLLGRLGRELSGETVQQLANEFGKRLLRELTEEFGARGIRELFEGLGVPLIRELTEEFGAHGLKELVDDVGIESIRRLVGEFTSTGLKQVHDELGRALFREFATVFSAASFKRLIDKIGARTARELAEAIGVREVRTLVQKFGYEGLAELVNKIGVQGIRDLGMKALKKLSGHLSPKEIGEWFIDLGATKMRHVAETYGARSMKHYGKDWFKVYKGVTAQTQHHLLVGRFNDAGHLLSGCHDKTVFDGVVAAGNVVIDTTRTRVSGIYTEYSWRRPTQAATTLNPKTVVDRMSANWATWADRIRRATDELIRLRRFPINPDRIPPSDISGVKWWGYFRNDEIATFFPDITL